MACVKKLLVISLKDLREDDLKKFQWHLKEDDRISKSEIENADRLITVDKMVACFGEEEAVKNMVEILRKMNQNDLAEQLENNLKQDRALDMLIQGKSNQSRALSSSLGRTGLIKSEFGLRNAEELLRNHDRAWDMHIQGKSNQLGLWPESRAFSSPLGRTGLIKSEFGLSNPGELLRNHVTGTNIVSRTRNEVQQYSHTMTLNMNTTHKRIGLSEENTEITRTYTKHDHSFSSSYRKL